MSMSKWTFNVEAPTADEAKAVANAFEAASNNMPGVVVCGRTWVNYAQAAAGKAPFKVEFNGVAFDRTADGPVG